MVNSTLKGGKRDLLEGSPAKFDSQNASPALSCCPRNTAVRGNQKQFHALYIGIVLGTAQRVFPTEKNKSATKHWATVSQLCPQVFWMFCLSLTLYLCSALQTTLHRSTQYRQCESEQGHVTKVRAVSLSTARVIHSAQGNYSRRQDRNCRGT